jgi:hypothetical protein
MSKIVVQIVTNLWGEDEEYPRSAWKYDVADDATNLGYWEWVENQKAMNEVVEE